MPKRRSDFLRPLQHERGSPRNVLEEFRGPPRETDQIITAVLGRSKHHAVASAVQPCQRGADVRRRQGGKIRSDQHDAVETVREELTPAVAHAIAEGCPALRYKQGRERRECSNLGLSIGWCIEHGLLGRSAPRSIQEYPSAVPVGGLYRHRCRAPGSTSTFPSRMVREP